MEASHIAPAVHALDAVGPALAALLFVLGMSRVPEPVRGKIMAVMTAGFATAYIGGSLGAWELLYLAPASYVAYRALDSYYFVAVGWLMHPIWDLIHHFYGAPLWPWMPTSSIGCAVFDPIIGIYALALAKSRGQRSRLAAIRDTMPAAR